MISSAARVAHVAHVTPGDPEGEIADGKEAVRLVELYEKALRVEQYAQDDDSKCPADFVCSLSLEVPLHSICCSCDELFHTQIFFRAIRSEGFEGTALRAMRLL